MWWNLFKQRQISVKPLKSKVFDKSVDNSREFFFFTKKQILTLISVFTIPHLTHRLRFTLSNYFAYFQWKLFFFAGKFLQQPYSRVKLISQSKEFGPKPSINFLANFPNVHTQTYIGPIILINDNHLVWKTFFVPGKWNFACYVFKYWLH